MTNENGKTPAEIEDFEEMSERYLLGELSEPEQEALEAAYFADNDLFERYLAVKDDLLDAYARGQLPPEKHTRLAEHFQATPPRRRHLQETKDFIQAITDTAAGPVKAEIAPASATIPVTESRSFSQKIRDFFKFPQLVRIGGLAALLILIGGVIWFVFRNPEPESAQVEQPVSEVTPANQNNQPNVQDDQRSGQISPQPPASVTPVDKNQNVTLKPTPAATDQVSNVNDPNPANFNQSPANTNVAPEPTPPNPSKQPTPASPQIATILLTPVATRNIGRANTLPLTDQTGSARLTLVFRSDDYQNYSVTINTVGGGSVFSQKGLRAGGSGANKSITVQIAAINLKPQDYIVTVRGLNGAQSEVVAEYYFRVSRNSP